ncbi:LysR family transcriptional regulator [Yoonia sp.]|jgi:DNA-binding transcriptional LysR family regulator|uniref:LysR family transcriptional regulator n=1 Tax=Yoonia sp. TaxID=2212373 RepID=UPI0040480449
MPARLPLTALRAFEAAARNGSLTVAASELGVTRPAVSKQIKQLEQMLDCALMIRLGNAVQLTAAGQDLAHDVSLAFGQIAASLERQTQGRSHSNVIRILVDRDFASSFLAGHIGQFLLRNPGVSVEVVAEKNGRMRLEEDFNFRIFYGNFGAAPCPGLRERVLCHWYDLVVCTPDYASEHVNGEGALIEAQLLIDSNYNVWDSWFAQTGLSHPGPPRDITHFNETSLCLSTALTGGGITIGDTILAFPAIRAGRLALPFRHGLESEQCYSLFDRAGRLHTSSETSFLEWLSEVVRQHETEVSAFLEESGIDILHGRKWVDRVDTAETAVIA